MRPPMQKNALQQNEANRLHQLQQKHHHYHQQQQQQQQRNKNNQSAFVITNVTDIPPTTNAQEHIVDKLSRKLDRERELLVENHLITACSTVLSPPNAAASVKKLLSAKVEQSDAYQSETNLFAGHQVIADESAELLNIATSPTHETAEYFQKQQQQQPVDEVPPCNTTNAINSSNIQRSSLFSQYSRCSTSSEDCSLSVDSTGPYTSHSIHNFDDAAEKFIINYPADTITATTPLLSRNKNDCIINLPLSETEPLLTNIEATVNDTERSIYLHKNSNSLVFTKKDLPGSGFNPFKTLTQSASRRSHTTNNNIGRNSQTTNTQSSSGVKSSDFAAVALRRQQHNNCHSNLRSNSEETHKRKTATKHLPASHQQQSFQRRSLQLNYSNNNNLITSTTCIGHNNNHLCSSSSINCNINVGNCQAGFLHKLPASKRSQPEECTKSSSNRKQLSYSWYAPVYSALEEELEQDSRHSSPQHNLANQKKKQLNKEGKGSTDNGDLTEKDTEILLDTRPHHTKGKPINIETTKSRNNSGGGNKLSLPLQHSLNSSSKGCLQPPANRDISPTDRTTFGPVAAGFASYESAEGPQASSLGLVGGPQPRRVRFGNFLKSLVGLRPSINSHQSLANNYEQNQNSSPAGNGNAGVSQVPTTGPSSPEITITRAPSERNVGDQQATVRSPEKLANVGSSASLNMMQQKLWNIIRRDGSSNSLYHEKSQSIVQYTNLRKCETVLALTRQANSLCSPTLGGGSGGGGVGGFSQSRNHVTGSRLRLPSTSSHMGSGVFSANGVEQIRPLNRLRNSAFSINATCSRCSSLLSMAATDSRFSLNGTSGNGGITMRNPSHVSNNNLNNRKVIGNSSETTAFAEYSGCMLNGTKSSGRMLAIGARTVRTNSMGSCSSSRSNSKTSTSVTSPITAPVTSTSSSTSSPPPPSAAQPPTDPNNTLTVPNSPTLYVTLKEENEQEVFAAKAVMFSAAAPKNATTDTQMLQGNTVSANASISSFGQINNSNNNNNNKNNNNNSYVFAGNPLTKKSVTLLTQTEELATVESSTLSSLKSSTNMLHGNDAGTQTTTTTPSPHPFEKFTCKLCLGDVEKASDSTILQQCGCQFCTECMRAYVEFEICEGAYEISCPDAQCWAQGVMQLPEIANLTTSNLMKKHHRYRLNREIELDKNRTWCPRAGCETICLIDTVNQQEQQQQSDSQPSTSSATNATNATTFTSIASDLMNTNGVEINGDHITVLCIPVQCPSCKDEFCLACKKSWHPNLTCEEYSRRLVADGHEDIGIPFDNDLIKCCPMCAVPIEKDEGCAQMMCKRCKHVFCWYCLASLDDDFLLRHYDKGPCKNKLGHSRASVVWHRAQVIGIFAGFGILLLVASPLLLLAAPCIICCKCRSCGGSKIDEGDGELDEATALQSLN